jgi:hypothetical protein
MRFGVSRGPGKFVHLGVPGFWSWFWGGQGGREAGKLSTNRRLDIYVDMWISVHMHMQDCRSVAILAQAADFSFVLSPMMVAKSRVALRTA